MEPVGLAFSLFAGRAENASVQKWRIVTVRVSDGVVQNIIINLVRREGGGYTRSSNKMPLSFRTTKLDSKIGSHKDKPGGERRGKGGTSDSVTARYINRKPYTKHRNRVAWSQLTIALQSPVSCPERTDKRISFPLSLLHETL